MHFHRAPHSRRESKTLAQDDCARAKPLNKVEEEHHGHP
jgi:hypothetical protein